MKHLDNLQEVAALQPDYLGFIFYDKSPRYMLPTLTGEALRQLPASIQKVGVFVNAAEEDLLRLVKHYDLQAVQLHGDEPPAVCDRIRQEGVAVIKVFRVGEAFDMQQLLPYDGKVDYFLFDTQGKQYGGTGETFNWQLLKGYPLQTPFFLSGGIALTSLEQVSGLPQLPLHALDVNSKFEIEPGRKNIAALEELFQHPILFKE